MLPLVYDMFKYIDIHNENGVDVDKMYASGLFARKSDAASWLSRWKRKGYLRTEKKKNIPTRYFTVVDGSLNDWSTLLGMNNQQIKLVREQQKMSEDNRS